MSWRFLLSTYAFACAAILGCSDRVRDHNAETLTTSPASADLREVASEAPIDLTKRSINTDAAEDRYEIASTDYLSAYVAQKPTSLPIEFAGTFVAIPDALRERAAEAFPRHQFVVARIYYSHWAPRDGTADILLVLEAATGTVVGHQWAVWFGDPSESFYHLLEQYPANSMEDAVSRVSVLADLMAITTKNCSPRAIAVENGNVEFELLWKDDLWRIIRIPVDEQWHFGPIAYINPKAPPG